LIFIASKKGAGQDGPMILDERGQPVWFSKDKYATDLKVQNYRGRPVLIWWEGRVVQGHGVGEYVILDDSYREMTRVRAGSGYRGDLHEFSITLRDTALITIYHEVPMDLSSVGDAKQGVVLDGVLQEIDIDNGNVLFEWHSLDHVDLDETYSEPPEDPRYPLDYFHINSIDVDHDGNLLVSTKRTSAVYKIDREAGEVLWRLGGKKSDFEMGDGTRFAYQHDARRQPDGTITIFDNGAAPKVHDRSRGIVLELETGRMTATLAREYTSPDQLLSSSQGNVQVLPNGNVFVGWGSAPYLSEFDGEGGLLFNATFPGGDQSYRAFRMKWSGHPTDNPAVAAKSSAGDKVTVYASWNGATEVESWQVLAGPEADRLEPVESVPRKGFETEISLQTTGPYVGVQAKDGSGRVLGSFKAVETRG
jgi:hypothetical protein